jgi:ammonium transporter, Amt family
MQQGTEVFFLLMGAILVFAMHGGFAFLETGTVRHKNQVNALVKILVDFTLFRPSPTSSSATRSPMA